MVQHLTWARFGNKETMPFDIAPQVQQQLGLRDVEQAQGNGGRTGAGTHGVHLEPPTRMARVTHFFKFPSSVVVY